MYASEQRESIDLRRRQRMKENLNQITEIYAKKPVKAVVIPKNSEMYKDL